MITPILQLKPDHVQDLKGIFFDIDDTFSTSGKIPASAYQALWNLKNRGYKLVPITGRPAGWCDHIARMWPVDGVVGENGAFYYRVDESEGKFIKRFFDKDVVREEKRRMLKLIRDEILESVPGTALASDQSYREADLAIDFCEDVPRLDWDSINRICEIFEKHGATCKVSSIHVNGWFGNYSKLNMTRTLVSELWDMDLDDEKERFVYFGDSPNDEPMFNFFPVSVGVNNVLNFIDKMESLPTYVTENEGGDGFAEAIGIILNTIDTRL